MSVVETLTGPVADQVLHLPLDRVAPSPDNPRGAVGDVDGLAASIEANGLVQPIVVYPADGDGMHEIVAGHRRYAAHVQLGAPTIPCLVRDRPDDEAHTAAARIVENVQRADLTVADEARAYAALSRLGWSQREIATAVGVNQSHVSKRTALTLAPADLLDAVDAGDVTVEQALAWVHVKRKGDDGDADQLLELFRGADAWRFARALETMVRRVKLAEARQRALTAARKAADAGEGPPVRDDVDLSHGAGYSALRVAGMVPASHLTEDYGTGARATRDQLAAHGTLAVVVDHRGELLEVCTDPARYEPDEPDEPAHTPGREPARADLAARLSASSGRRREWLVDHLAAHPDAPAAYVWLIRLLVDVALDAHTADVLKLAARAAGLDPSGSGTDVKRRVREAVDVDHPTTEQVATACRFAQALHLLRADRAVSAWGRPSEADRAHLDRLADLGWDLSDAEREWLADEEDDAE